jgi:serine/threonine protein kinase
MLVNKIITGGKLLDTGGYSCVFDPPLRCKGKTMKSHGHMISKLMTKEDSETEWEISEIIRKIPLWKNYFAVSESICELGLNQVDSDLKTKCEFIKYINPSQLRILQMPYAGKPLQNYTLRSDFNLMSFITHVLEAGALLVLNNVIHFDLHPGNILINNNGVPHLIDFNLSLVSNKSVSVSELSYRFSRNFHLIQQPPDYTAVLGIEQGKSMDNIISNIEKKDIISYIKSIIGIHPSIIRKDIKNLILNPYIAKGDIIGWFNHYWTKIDSWAIGAYFVDMFKKHSMLPQIGGAYHKNQTKLKKILQGLCDINPNQRWDCVQALYYMNPNSIVIKRFGYKWLDKYGRPT